MHYINWHWHWQWLANLGRWTRERERDYSLLVNCGRCLRFRWAAATTNSHFAKISKFCTVDLALKIVEFCSSSAISRLSRTVCIHLRLLLCRCSRRRFDFPCPPFDNMVIVLRLRGNIIRTVLYCQCGIFSTGTANKNSSYSPVVPWVCLFVFFN